MLSIVGPYISFEVSYYAEGGAHPSYGTFYKVINIINGKRVSLKQLFSKKVLFKTLIADSVIKKALSATPRNLDELFKNADGGCEMFIHESILSSFAFHHIKNNKVAVRIGISHGCEINRGDFTQIGIYLPIPKNLIHILLKLTKIKRL